MANKKITDLTAGTITDSQLLFIGDPSTGALSNITGANLKTYTGGGGGTVLNGTGYVKMSGTTPSYVPKLSLTSEVSGTLPVASGGTGTTTPGIVAGSGIAISGTWPNQTVSASGGSSGPLVYAANLSQSSSSAPTVTTPVNTTGATITFARTSAGVYTATAGSAIFTVNKTFVFFTPVSGGPHITMKVSSTTVIDIQTFDLTTTLNDGQLNGNSFKIEIYP